MTTPTAAELLGDIRVHGALPRHVAIIMDGNGRWARERLMPRPFGHRGGMKAVRDVVEGAVELGLDPSSQGGTIRVPLPQMNEQRRKELVKVVHKHAEDGRIVVRRGRTDGRDKLKKLQGTSEDDVKHAEKDLQKVHDDFIAQIDSMLKAKEVEIMSV